MKPIVSRGFRHECPFTRWVRDNTSVLMLGPRGEDIKRHGLAAIRDTYSTRQCPLSIWKPGRQSVSVGLMVDAQGAGSGRWRRLVPRDRGWWMETCLSSGETPISIPPANGAMAGWQASDRLTGVSIRTKRTRLWCLPAGFITRSAGFLISTYVSLILINTAKQHKYQLKLILTNTHRPDPHKSRGPEDCEYTEPLELSDSSSSRDITFELECELFGNPPSTIEAGGSDRSNDEEDDGNAD